MLQPNSRLLGITLKKDLIFLNLNFFKIFFMLKKINLRHRAGHVTSKD